ncbi:MAG: hypothetical protein AAF518_11765 [Spirochaetota bacterium]
MKTLVLIFFLTLGQLFANATNTKHREIKNLLKAKQTEKAYSVLNIELKQNPHDPTLNLYLTEIWIEKADQYYRQNKYNKALYYYEKAYKAWQTHPTVRERYFELKNRGITAEKSEILYKEPEPKKQEPFVIKFPEIQNNTGHYLELGRRMEDRMGRLEEKLQNIQLQQTFGFGVLFGTHIVLLLYLLITGRKK